MDRTIDFTRMRAERRTRLQSAMEAAGLDAVVLLGPANQEYAGVTRAFADAMRTHYEPVTVVVPAGGLPHVWTPFPEGAFDLPDGNVGRELPLELDEGVDALGARLHELVPGARRVGFDELTSPMLGRLASLLPGVEIADAGAATIPARLQKTADEIECMRASQRINEIAMYDVEAALRPGVRQNELSAIFLRRCFELGTSWSCIDPIWNITPPARARQTRTTNGDVGFPLASNDRFLREGDLVLPDTGVVWNGYHSDFGKTWICSVDPKPPPKLRSCYERWRNVIEVAYAGIKPGRSCGDVVRDVMAVEPQYRLEQFYLAHGAGCDSAEMPFLGSELGFEVEDTIELLPGMTFVLEPVIWEDGVGGYRSEEVVAVTNHGCERLSTYGYTPFE
ncbi:MAG TPA: Xaa-Pro peptidase family protein [Acidimicrobiales bacterium]|jgi:Xaa-Pro aminopeptidase|nr:Xaa-Pro peptidase family protein [Acidimicrobiales bacterium]